ncbi:MAG: hypothetical protein DCC68_11125 [Planctomycetota bacterium]|nr:MAG: hypothetical protein DCC68_11125 [Planctomycetota bacterium]
MSMTPPHSDESRDSQRDAMPAASHTRRPTHRAVNFRLLIASVLALALLGGAAYLWRNHQVEKLADSLLARVAQLEEEKDWTKAVAYLHQYLRLNPDEDEIHVRAALVFDHDLQTPRQLDEATRLYYRALGVAPDDARLRRRLAELLLELGRRAQAEIEAKKLLEAEETRDDATAKRIVALVAAAESQIRGTVEAAEAAFHTLDRANAAQPGDATVAARLALLYRTRAEKLGKTNEEAAKLADDVIEKMIVAAPNSADSFLTRAQYRAAFSLPGARGDFERALELEPRSETALLAAGQYYLSAPPPERDADRARKLFERLVEVAPTRDAGYFFLGRAHKALGSTQAAVDTWKLGLQRTGGDNEAINVELFETHLAARDLAAARDALDLLIKRAEANSLFLRTDARIRQRFMLARLEAQWLLANNEPSRVVSLLTNAIVTSGSLGTSTEQNPELDRVRVLLAQAYAALENWDQAAAAYSEVASRSTTPWGSALLAAEAWKRAGQLDKAIAGYRQAAEQEQAPPQLWLGLGQAQLEQQARIGSLDQRDWKPFLDTLAKAKQENPGSWAVRFLEVDYFLAQQTDADRQRAEALLRAGEKDYETEPQYWQRLIFAYERFKRPDDADRALRQYLSLEKNAIEAAVARVNLLAMRKQFAEAEKILATAIAESPAPLRKALLYRQMQLAVEAGDLAAGRRRLAALRADDPTNLRILRRSAELAFEARDWKELAQLDEPLRKAEGENGHGWRFYRAAHLLADPARRSPNDLEEAERLVTAILKDRPRWTPATVLMGQIAEARGDVSTAVERYTSAVEAGDRRIFTYERLISLLYRLNRFAEAQQIIDQMGRGAFSSDRLESLAMAVAVQQDERGRAVELARQSLAERPEDAMRYVWLAEMLQFDGKREEAIATLQKAVKLAPNDIRPWNAVFMYHLRGRDMAKAERTLLETTKQVPLEPAQKAFVLAQGYELLGKRPEALANYRQASELAPKDIAILSRLAALALNDDVAAAEGTLRKIVALAPENARARQALATLLALRDDDGAWTEAQELLRQATQGGAPVAADDRLRAVLLVRRGGDKQQRIAQHAEARKILESRIAADAKPSAADRLLLAGVYESEARLTSDESKLQAARDQLWSLFDAAESSEAHLALAADFAIRHCGAQAAKSPLPIGDELRTNMLSDAQACVERIEALERKADRYPSNRSLALRARLMAAQDRGSEIEQLAEPLAEQRLAALKKDADKDQWIVSVGNVYSSVDLHAAAERWYRKLWPRVSTAYTPLVQSLAAQGRFDEVVKVCEAAAKSEASARPAQILASVFAAGKPTPNDLGLAEPVLAQALKEHSGNADLLFSAAVLRTVQGRPLDAITLFEAVVKVAPNHLLALNNLATLLAEQPHRQKDALRYIEQAISVAGRKPALLDTQGTIHLMDGNLDAAVKCLEEAVESEAVDPRYAFHLAAAYAKAGRQDDARKAFEKSKQNGLDEYVLTEGDLALRAMLEKTL